MFSASKLPSSVAVATLFLALLGGTAAAQTGTPETASQDTIPQPERDAVGDLNAAGVRAGSFPGAVVLPGTQTSLAIGGFIKTVGIIDSRAERSGAMLLPGTFGPGIGDDGNFAVDATLSRLYFDARAPAAEGSVRGYLEWDFNGSNSGTLALRPRLAFATWETGRGSLLAGHNWSTFMDLKVIPEGLTEPTVSGAIFARQAQIRWTQPLPGGARAEIALEDPSATDLYSEEAGIGRTRLPDFAAAIETKDGSFGHLRVGGILRRLESAEAIGVSPATGWGVAVTGHLNVGGSDRLAAGGAYGEGIARYILGNGPTASGVVDPASDKLEVFRNHGYFLSYRHRWGERTRSTLALGSAGAEVPDNQPDAAFRSTQYGFLNLMYSPLPYVTWGVEYAYARYEAVDGATTDDHRAVIGVQIF